jgi:hypothetical protein
MDGRLRNVEGQIGDLRETVARLTEAERNSHESRLELCRLIRDLQVTVQDLRDDRNKGLGIVWAVGGTGGGVLGAILVWLLGKFWH